MDIGWELRVQLGLAALMEAEEGAGVPAAGPIHCRLLKARTVWAESAEVGVRAARLAVAALRDPQVAEPLESLSLALLR